MTISDAVEIEDDTARDETTEDDQLTPADLEGVVQYTLDWSVQSLLERIGNTFDVNPSFQRRDAWDGQRKSLYIESLMLGLPVPQIVLAEDPKQRGRFIVLDGKQRLVTLKQFAAPDANFPTLTLGNMDFLGHFKGRTFATLRESEDGGEFAENLLTQPVRTIVIRNWVKESVLYQIFVRLNQGSLPLSPQELRQALFPGDFTNWVNKRSANSAAIQRARRLPREDFRMRDAEMLLRFVALAERMSNYAGNLREFLDEMCRVGNRDMENKSGHYEDLAASCETAIARTELIFSSANSFLRFLDDRYVRRFNIAVFDCMSLVLSAPEITDDLVAAHRDELRLGFERLCDGDADFQDFLVFTTKTTRATFGRVAKWGAVVEEILGIKLLRVQEASAAFSRLDHGA